MVKKRNLTLILLIACILTSCNRQLNISDYIDKTKPLEMRITKSNKLTQFDSICIFSIPVNSKKYSRLILWLENHKTGWKTMPASYVADICITQGNFRLIYRIGSSGVVVGFTDSNNNPKQYSNTFNPGNLNFLSD